MNLEEILKELYFVRDIINGKINISHINACNFFDYDYIFESLRIINNLGNKKQSDEFTKEKFDKLIQTAQKDMSKKTIFSDLLEFRKIFVRELNKNKENIDIDNIYKISKNILTTGIYDDGERKYLTSLLVSYIMKNQKYSMFKLQCSSIIPSVYSKEEKKFLTEDVMLDLKRLLLVPVIKKYSKLLEDFLHERGKNIHDYGYCGLLKQEYSSNYVTEFKYRYSLPQNVSLINFLPLDYLEAALNGIINTFKDISRDNSLIGEDDKVNNAYYLNMHKESEKANLEPLQSCLRDDIKRKGSIQQIIKTLDEEFELKNSNKIVEGTLFSQKFIKGKKR